MRVVSSFLLAALTLAACGGGTNHGSGADATTADAPMPPHIDAAVDGSSPTLDSGAAIDATTPLIDADTTPDATTLCSSAADCDDTNACTADSCDATGTCQHTAVAVDDGNACTIDGCDPASGPIHTPVDPSDGDPCTTDACDPTTGVSHTAVAVDDGNVCTTDSCDSATGFVAHDPIAVDDADACTVDGCDPALGPTHTPIDPSDGNACTTDLCDPTTGVSHIPVVTSDGDACTTDACDPATGAIAHTPIVIDDGNGCTTDACDSTSGAVSHTPVSVDDGSVCTTDSCDPASGAISHTPIALTDSVPCTDDTCDPVAGVSHTPNDANCPPGQTCNPVNNCVITPIDIMISEFRSIGPATSEFVEIANLDPSPVYITSYTLTNAASQVAVIHAASDPTGTLGTPVTIPASGYAYGVPNPVDPATIPPTASFVYGDPGTSFTLNDTGDSITIADPMGGVDDVVDFTNFQADPTMPIMLGQFPGLAGKSTQLEPTQFGPSANDSGDNWCITFRAAATPGQPNQSCFVLVVNEILYDFAHPVLGGADDTEVFVELAGPGGANLSGVHVLGKDGDGIANQAPNTTITAGTRMPVDGIFVIADGNAALTTLVPNADLVISNGDPTNGDTNGDGIEVLAQSGVLLDSMAYGPATAVFEGAPVQDIDPDRVAISLARDANSTDTDNNAADFHFDPTPTPGLPNDALAPAIIGPVVPSEGLSTTTTTTTWLVHDFADFRNLNGVAVADNDINATFAGHVTADTTLFTDGCTITNITNNGRGDATMTCVAPSNTGTVVRGDLVLTNPATFGGGSVTLTNGWTYTGIRNETNVAAEADFCDLMMPATMATMSNTATPQVFAQVLEANVANTAAAGADPNVLGSVGYGPLGSNPATASTWFWTPTTWNAQVGSNDQYAGAFTAPTVVAATQFAYTTRFSFDGGLTWTLCDLNGAGSSGAFTFQATQLGVLTVSP